MQLIEYRLQQIHDRQEVMMQRIDSIEEALVRFSGMWVFGRWAIAAIAGLGAVLLWANDHIKV